MACRLRLSQLPHSSNMIFSGYNSRKIGEGKNFTFAINFLVEPAYYWAVYEFGFSGSGAGENITFHLSGKGGEWQGGKYVQSRGGAMIDPDGKHFGYYQQGERTLISGNVSSSTYDYYVGNKQNYTEGSKSDFIINSFFVNSEPKYRGSWQGLDADIYISPIDF